MPRTNYPKAMSKWRRAVKAGKNAADFGFVISSDELFRFCQRYRVANSFRGVQLDGYSPSTTIGYSAFFRILLCWSAFERYLHAIGMQQRSCQPLLAAYNPEDRIERIRAIDRGGKLYLFLAGAVNPAHQRQLARYFHDQRFNITYLASAVRHIFAHGSLTAHVNRTKPATIKQISNVLCEFLLCVLHSEFSKHFEATPSA